MSTSDLCGPNTPKSLKLFCEAANNISNVGSKFTGESFNYSNFVQPTENLNINAGGSFGQLGDNLSGLLDYTQLLILGGQEQRASTTGKNFGSRYLLSTGTQCKAMDSQNRPIMDGSSNKMEDRSVIINNYKFIIKK